MTSNGDRVYHSLDPSAGYPAGSDLSYECRQCGGSVPSLPERSVGCSCGNVFIDVDYGRVCIRDHNKVRLFSEAND